MSTVINIPSAVKEEFNCQNYLIVKVPSKAAIVNTGANILLILCSIKLAPVIGIVAGTLTLNGWLYAGTATLALIAKRLVKK